jgi:hypothetical protein
MDRTQEQSAGYGDRSNLPAERLLHLLQDSIEGQQFNSSSVSTPRLARRTGAGPGAGSAEYGYG